MSDTKRKQNTDYHWDPKSEIKISGIEFMMLQRVLSIFEPGLATIQTIFDRMIEEGIAKEGKPPAQEETPPAENTDEGTPV